MLPIGPNMRAIAIIRTIHWQRLISNPDHPYHWVTQLPEPDLDVKSWFADETI